MQFKAKITWFLDGIPIINADITSHSDNTEEASNKEYFAISNIRQFLILIWFLFFFAGWK